MEVKKQHEAKVKQPNRTYLTPEQKIERQKASKRVYYHKNRHEFLQPGGRYYDCIHKKATCDRCGAVRDASRLKKHQASRRCHIKDSTPS